MRVRHVVLLFAALGLLGASSGPGARPRKAARAGSTVTRTVVTIGNLDQGRQFAAIVDRQRPALDRLDGVLKSGSNEARVAAFLEAGDLRLIEESATFAKDGGTARNRYYVYEGRLAFYESLRVRPRDVGKDRLPARDEVLTTLAYHASGKLVGSEKTVNREPVKLESADLQAVQGRFAALGQVVERSRSGGR